MISASHNPFDDNGIKVFSGEGEKFTEALEREVEAIVAGPTGRCPPTRLTRFAARTSSTRTSAHTRLALPDPERLRARKHRARHGQRRDHDRGAAAVRGARLRRRAASAPRRTAGTSTSIAARRIPQRLSQAVRERRCRMGVAFDGDGDRAIFVDADGRIVDGDAVLLMCARQMKAQGRLTGNAVVATVMSNIGLEIALRDSGIEMVRCPVGDKYVMEEMLERDLSLGGEQSGHIIFADHLFTGDGIATALNVLRVMAETGRELADLAAELVTYPQVLVNVRVREKKDLQTRAGDRGGDGAGRGAARRPGPAAGPLLGHRAAAARHDRGQGSAGDPGVGARRSPGQP